LAFAGGADILLSYLQAKKTEFKEEKIDKLGLSETNDAKSNLDIRFALINKINPLKSRASDLEDTVLQILREVIEYR